MFIFKFFIISNFDFDQYLCKCTVRPMYSDNQRILELADGFYTQELALNSPIMSLGHRNCAV